MLPRIPDTPPVILPLSEEENLQGPVWSVMIPVYNSSEYLQQTLLSIIHSVTEIKFIQIEVVDDASTDTDIKEIVQNIGKGRINYYRQETNVGSLRNFETCINRAKGKLIHLLHGDDKVLPGFYEKMELLFQQYPSAGAAFCRYNYIDEKSIILFPSDEEMKVNGILDNWLQRIAGHQLIQTPSIVVKREIYERLGSFYAVHYGEDWEMWVRIAANYPVAYCPEILAEYRQHNNSISGNYFLTGQNIRDLKKVIQLNSEKLPASEKEKIKKEAEKFYAHYAISTARMLWYKYKNKNAAEVQIKEALSLYTDSIIKKEILKLKIKFLFGIR